MNVLKRLSSVVVATACAGALGCADIPTAPENGTPPAPLTPNGVSYVVRSDEAANQWLRQVYAQQPGGYVAFETRRENASMRAPQMPATVGGGEEGPAVINVWRTVVDIIPNNTHIAADVNFSNGSVGRNEISWSQISRSTDQVVHSGSHSDQGDGYLEWDWSQTKTTDLEFTLPRYCGFKLSASTTHSAWKELPWPSTIQWGNAQSKVSVDTDDGTDCQDECTIQGPQSSGASGPQAAGVTCGEGTIPGGGGSDDPIDSPSTNCHWVRDFIVYSDGSWTWISAWYQECEGWATVGAEESGNEPARPVRVRVLAQGRLESARAVEIHRNPAVDVDVVVRIDSTRVTAADLEAAFGVALRLEASAGTSYLGAVQGTPSTAIKARSGAGSRADQHIRSVLRGQATNHVRFGSARSYLVTIPSLRRRP